MGLDACEAMASFSQDEYTPLPEVVQDDVLHACLQGATIAKAFIQWARLVKWPPDIQADYDMHDKGDWGGLMVRIACFFLLDHGFSMSDSVEWRRCAIKVH